MTGYTDRDSLIVNERCQVFTPKDVVNEMLDICGYTEHIRGKKVLENSFGDGAILFRIVKRYILAACKEGISKHKIKQGLESDIYGIEIDKRLFDSTIKKLSKLAERYGIKKVNWSLFNCNALMWTVDIKFDLVIGNPPYVSYRFLSTNDREYLRKSFKSCSTGRFDYCYAFIEKGISYLKDTGMLVQLVPVSIYKNTSAWVLRDMLVHGITKIIDYSSRDVFGRAMVASSVFIYANGVESDKIVYISKCANSREYVDKKNFGRKWVFGEYSLNFSPESSIKNSYKIFHSVATQLNSVFVVDKQTIKRFGIEKHILRKTISPRYFNREKELFIIYPYILRKSGRVEHYTEKQFMQKCPCAAKYLESHKVALLKRDADRSAQWFEYGRSQAINKLNRAKLLLSTIVTGHIKILLLDENYIPYSGICITANTFTDLIKLKKMLESEYFLSYVKQNGIPVHGDSVRISTKDISEWLISVRRHFYGAVKL